MNLQQVMETQLAKDRLLACSDNKKCKQCGGTMEAGGPGSGCRGPNCGRKKKNYSVPGTDKIRRGNALSKLGDDIPNVLRVLKEQPKLRKMHKIALKHGYIPDDYSTWSHSEAGIVYTHPSGHSMDISRIGWYNENGEFKDAKKFKDKTGRSSKTLAKYLGGIHKGSKGTK